MMSEASQTSMTETEITALHSAARALDSVLAASVRVLPIDPVEGSPIHDAYAADLHEPYHIAYALVVAAEDHLRAILQIVKTGPLPMYALYTLLRAAAEADVRARHLLDLRATPQERLGRGLNERLDNLEEQRKVLPEAHRHHFPTRVAHLQRRAATNGIAAVHSRPRAGKSPLLLGFGEARKSETELFGKYLRAGSVAFRFLSGYVHSKPWIWLQRNRARQTTTPGVLEAQIELDAMFFAQLLTAIVKLHQKNLGNWMILSGHPGEDSGEGTA